MKKLIMTVWITALILSLCACGSSDDPDKATLDSAAIHSNYDAACAYVGSAIDTSKMIASSQDDENGMYKYWIYNGDPENDKFGMDVEIDGKTVTVAKTTVSDLKDLGFEIDSDHDGESVEPGAIEGVTLKKGDKTCSLAVQNNSDKAQDLSKLTVFQFSGGSEDTSLTFSYNGIGNDATLEDVINAFGAPKSSVTVSADGTGTTITLNYISSAAEDDIVTSDTLDIYLSYDAEQNTATLSSLNLSRYSEKA